MMCWGKSNIKFYTTPANLEHRIHPLVCNSCAWASTYISFSNPEDGGDTVLRNARTHASYIQVKKNRRPSFEQHPPWKHESLEKELGLHEKVWGGGGILVFWKPEWLVMKEDGYVISCPNVTVQYICFLVFYWLRAELTHWVLLLLFKSSEAPAQLIIHRFYIFADFILCLRNEIYLFSDW